MLESDDCQFLCTCLRQIGAGTDRCFYFSHLYAIDEGVLIGMGALYFRGPLSRGFLTKMWMKTRPVFTKFFITHLH